MKNVLFVLMISLGLYACNKEVQPLTKEQVNYKIDSVVRASRAESDEQARIDLGRRMKIEVKVKVDSILNARAKVEKKDTARKTSDW